MKIVKLTLILLLAAPVLLVIGLNIWGSLTLGTLQPEPDAVRDSRANEVVMIFGATGRAGGGLVVAAAEDPQVERVIVVTRRRIPLLDALEAAGEIELRLHQDYTDYN